MATPQWLLKLFSTGGKAIVDSVGNVLDELITNKEEKAQKMLEIEKEVNRHIEVLASEANNELELQLKDVANSRDTNTSIQLSDKASWLAKNTGYCLDIFIILIWATMTIYIAAKYFNILKSQAGVDFSGVLGIYAGVTGLATQVLAWHRGSSRGSDEKQKHIEKLTK